MQKQGTKHRFIISMSYKVFVKHFTIFNFSQTQQQTLPNDFHCLELELYIYTFVCCIVSVVFLFVCFLFLLVRFFVYVVIIILMLLCHLPLLLCILTFRFIYVHLRHLCSYGLAVWHYNFTII